MTPFHRGACAFPWMIAAIARRLTRGARGRLCPLALLSWVAAIAGVLGAGCPAPPPEPDLRQPVDLAPQRVAGGGLDAPWGLAWDPGSAAYYISNVGGSLGVRDGRGWIARLPHGSAGPTGSLEGMWLGGLDAPLGLAAASGKLYVADLDTLVIVDIAARTLSRVPVPGARLLSGVAVSSKGSLRVYLADAAQRSISLYAPPAAPVLLLQSDELLAVTALALDEDETWLWAASRGSLTDVTLPGRVQRVELATLRRQAVDLPMATQPGGLLFASGAVLLTDLPRAGLLGLRPAAGVAGGFVLLRDLRYDGLRLAGGLALTGSGTLAVVDPLGAETLLLQPDAWNTWPRPM